MSKSALLESAILLEMELAVFRELARNGGKMQIEQLAEELAYHLQGSHAKVGLQVFGSLEGFLNYLRMQNKISLILKSGIIYAI